FAAWRFTDANRFIRYLDVHRIGIRIRVDRHRPNVQLLAGTDNANGDLATVSDQDFFEHQFGRILNMAWPNSTGLAFSTRICVITPLTSALISFMTFIASMMQTTVSGLTSEPTST